MIQIDPLEQARAIQEFAGLPLSIQSSYRGMAVWYNRHYGTSHPVWRCRWLLREMQKCALPPTPEERAAGSWALRFGSPEAKKRYRALSLDLYGSDEEDMLRRELEPHAVRDCRIEQLRDGTYDPNWRYR